MDINQNSNQGGNPQSINRNKRKKKCHGNRRDQRFRKKYRARGMRSEKIEKLLRARKEIYNKKKNPNRNSIRSTTSNNQALSTVSKIKSTNHNDQLVQTKSKLNINKRKRNLSLQQLNLTLPKSTSSISISESLRKKRKNKNKIIRDDNTSIEIRNSSMNITNRRRRRRRRPMYLKRTPSLIIKMFGKILNYTFRNEVEKRYIFVRLDLFDRYHYQQSNQQLWESYLEIGIEQHLWPDRLYAMAKSNDFEICHQYLLNYIKNRRIELDQYHMELRKQSELCPLNNLSIEQIDSCLIGFVECQRKYLIMRNQRLLFYFQNRWHTDELTKSMSAYHILPNQNEITQRLTSIQKQQVEIYEELLMLEMRILYKFLPKEFDHLQYFIGSITYSPLNNNQKAIQMKNLRYKTIQEAKRQWLVVFLNAYEIKLIEYKEQYNLEFQLLKSQFLHSITIDGSSVLQQIKEYTVYQTKKLKQVTYQKISTYRSKLLRIRRNLSSSRKDIIGVSPETYLDLMSNSFTTRQWNHLSLGPSCIRMNQSAIRPRHQQEIQIKNEHKNIFDTIQHRLVSPPHRIPIKSLALITFSNDLLYYFNHSYFSPLSYKDQVRATEQAKTAVAIRRKIKKFNLIIRMTDKGHNFYIGSAVEFEKKAQQFFQETNAFMELAENPFHEILNKVIQLLNQIRQKKFITEWQYKKMMPDRTKSELAHLYFNPKTHKDGIPVRPIENTIMATTTKISNFLDEIIRPIFDNKCSTTSIIDGTSLITALNKYAKRGLLKPTTLFCTFDIRNLYTMLPQEEALNILVEFLHVHGYKKVKGIPLDAIRKLASIVLRENVFVYNKKIYRQVLGGAMGSSFTLTLANIFMWKWQKEFVRRQDMIGEFYGRYIDDIFMTWNQSEKALTDLLDQANTWHPNIKLEYKINKSLPFLDVLLTNNNGILLTSVYRKPAAEPYVVPFVSDHPSHTFVNIIRTNLARAVRYSSTFELFNNERIYIKLTLLYNGYPSSFIEKQFRKFFSGYISSTDFLPFIDNEKQFHNMRIELLNQRNYRQSQISMNAATVDIDNDPIDEVQKKINESDKKKHDSAEKLIVHYTHEKRFQSTKRDIHAVYDNVFEDTPIADLKLIVGNKNRRDSKNELIRKRPPQFLLQNKPTRRETQNKKRKKSSQKFITSTMS